MKNMNIQKCFHIRISFQNERLVANKTAKILISGSTSENILVLQKADRQKAGDYYCAGRNSEGYARSETVTLKVKCKYLFF